MNEKAKRFLTKNGVTSLLGRKIFLSGATSGIGEEAAKMMAELGAELFLPYRTERKKADLEKEIISSFPSTILHFYKYDQSSFSSIVAMSQALEKEDIDSFIFNAAVMHPDKGAVTETGNSLTFGTNALGVHELFSLLKKSHPNAQYCFVSSITNIPPGKKDYSSYLVPESHLRFLEYCVSKRAIMNIFVSSYEDEDNVVMAHPGVAKSQIYKGLGKIVYNLGNAVLTITTHPVWKAALSLVLLSSGNYSKGTYLVPRGLFEIWGYPKKKKIPAKAYHSYQNLEKTLLLAEERDTASFKE